MAIFKAVVDPATGKSIGHATTQKLEDYLKYEQERDERGLRKRKTEHITAINADAEDFSASCADVAARFNACRDYDSLKYKHYVQGFAPEDSKLMSKDKCHALGVEFARDVWGDFPVLVVTHFEQEVEATGEYHWHNHFLVYNCAVTDGHKIPTSKADLYAQKLFVAAQANAHGLTRRGLVIEDGELRSTRMDEKVGMAERHIRRAGQEKLDRENAVKTPEQIRQRTFLTQKAELRLAIRAARKKTTGFAEFCKYLEDVYEVKTKVSRGEISFLHPERVGTDRAWIRGRSLGEIYTKEGIARGFNEQTNRRADLGGGAATAEGGAVTERGALQDVSAGAEDAARGKRSIDELQRLYGEIFREDGAASRKGQGTVASAEGSDNRGRRKNGKHV